MECCWWLLTHLWQDNYDVQHLVIHKASEVLQAPYPCNNATHHGTIQFFDTLCQNNVSMSNTPTCPHKYPMQPTSSQHPIHSGNMVALMSGKTTPTTSPTVTSPKVIRI